MLEVFVNVGVGLVTVLGIGLVVAWLRPWSSLCVGDIKLWLFLVFDFAYSLFNNFACFSCRTQKDAWFQD